MSATFTTPTQALAQWAQQLPEQVFLSQPMLIGRARDYRYQETYETVRRIAMAFKSQGLVAGQRVGILSKNCAEWFMVDWALQMAGLISVPFYPTSRASKLVSAVEQMDIAFLIIGKLDNPELFRSLLSTNIPNASLPYDTLNTQLSWQQLTNYEPLAVEDMAQVRPTDVMTIHFTSGTSGNEKGVAITYGAYHYACQNAISSMTVSPSDRMMSYLPLAHIAERMMIEGNAIFSGARVYFVHSLATFARDLQAAKPTAFMSVPRLWKNFQTAIHAKIPAPILNRLLATPGINKLIQKLLRRVLGLSHARLTGSGAAAMPIELLRWYEKIGIPISEAWGLTETCGLSAMNYPYRSERAGTIGEAVPGTTMKVSHQGELLIKSEGVFHGYVDDNEANLAAFDDDGFFKTGDIAQWDHHIKGWRLSGRMNDSFKCTKGKFVSPAHIETLVQRHSLVEQVCVIGEGRKQPIALVQLATKTQPNADTEKALLQLRAEVNAQLEKHEQLDSLVISANVWTPENELLTPTMKVKRKRVITFFHQPLQAERFAPVHWLDKVNSLTAE